MRHPDRSVNTSVDGNNRADNKVVQMRDTQNASPSLQKAEFFIADGTVDG